MSWHYRACRLNKGPTLKTSCAITCNVRYPARSQTVIVRIVNRVCGGVCRSSPRKGMIGVCSHDAVCRRVSCAKRAPEPVHHRFFWKEKKKETAHMSCMRASPYDACTSNRPPRSPRLHKLTTKRKKLRKRRWGVIDPRKQSLQFVKRDPKRWFIIVRVQSKSYMSSYAVALVRIPVHVYAVYAYVQLPETEEVLAMAWSYQSGSAMKWRTR